MYVFTANELFVYFLIIALMFTLFGASIEYVWCDYYRQVSNEYKKELARQELQKLFEKGGDL